MPERFHRASKSLDSRLRGNDFDIQQIAGHGVADHIPDVRKMVDIGSGAKREIEDIATPTTHATSSLKTAARP